MKKSKPKKKIKIINKYLNAKNNYKSDWNNVEGY